MMACSHEREDNKAAAHFFSVNDDCPVLYQSRSIECLQAPPASVLRQADSVRQAALRLRGIALQLLKNTTIKMIYFMGHIYII